MDINNTMINVDQEYYSPEFINILEANIPYLYNLPSTKRIPVPDNHHAVYKGDCFSSFTELSIPANLHWITMRLSGMNSMYEFNNDIQYFVKPDTIVISNLLKLHQQSPGSIGL